MGKVSRAATCSNGHTYSQRKKKLDSFYITMYWSCPVSFFFECTYPQIFVHKLFSDFFYILETFSGTASVYFYFFEHLCYKCVVHSFISLILILKFLRVYWFKSFLGRNQEFTIKFAENTQCKDCVDIWSDRRIFPELEG